MAASAARDLQARPNQARARVRILKSPRKTASRGRYVVPSVSAVPRARGNAAGSGRAPRALAGSTAAWDSFVVVRSKCAIATVDLHSPPTRHDALRRCSVDTPAAAGLCPCKLVPRLSRMAAGCPAARRAAYSTRGERARRWEAAGTRRTAWCSTNRLCCRFKICQGPRARTIRGLDGSVSWVGSSNTARSCTVTCTA